MALFLCILSTGSVFGQDTTSTSEKPANTPVEEKKPQKSNIKTTINYDAKDSIAFNVVNSIITLYGGVYPDGLGGAHVDYGEIQMDAAIITIDWKTNNIACTYMYDSLGRKIGVPRLNDGGDIYEADTMVYNFKYKRAYIADLLTPQAGGWMSGKDNFKDENDVLYIEDGRFCPCDDPDNGTYIKSKKIKVVPKSDSTNGKVIVGPFLLHVEEVPTPLGLPFGIFPTSEEKASGVIIPTYGESATRGFYLRQGGFYFAMNDYIGMKFLGEIYSRGGWGGQLITNYKKRYSYGGSINFNYRNTVRDGDEYNREDKRDYQFRWTHKPASKGGRRLTANVNYATTSYASNNEIDPTKNLTATMNSNINYYLPFKGTPFSLNANFRHDQNNLTKVTNFKLPDFTVTMKRQNPFKFKGHRATSSIGKFRESINVSYTMTGRNNISNQGVTPSYDFTVINEDSLRGEQLPVVFDTLNLLWDRRQVGARHKIPVSASLKAGIFNINPSFNYSQFWFPSKLNFTPVGLDSVQVDTVTGLSVAHSYDARVSVNSRFYATYGFAGFLRGKRETQIRQTVIPTLGYSFTPDYTDENSFLNPYQTIVFDSANTTSESVYKNQLFSVPTSQRTSRMTMSLQTLFEMKVRSFKDTAVPYKKIKLLENLRASSSYDFAADSFNLANIALSGNTNLLNFINIRGSMTLDPYQSDTTDDGTVRRRNVYTWKTALEESEGRGIGRVSRASLALSTNLNPKSFQRQYKNQDENSYIRQYLIHNPDIPYVDWELPWSLNISYVLGYSKTAFTESTMTQSLKFSGQIKPTKKWAVRYNVSYDIEKKKLLTPRINIHRDLNCWEMRFSWVPFGPQQSYEFFVNIKAAMLKDIVKLNRRSTFYDR